MTAPVSVAELQRAWAAVETGQFRVPQSSRRERRQTWHPAGQAIVVLGATGRVGASTVALAMGAAAGPDARVVECAPPHSTGLAYATSAELGVVDGWRQGTRDELLIERPVGAFGIRGDVPCPTDTARERTILDVPSCVFPGLSTENWLSDVIAAGPLVVVTVATVPGLRALDRLLVEAALPNDRVWSVAVGIPVKRWSKELRFAMTARVRDAAAAGRLLAIPEDPQLRLTGLTVEPLPRQVASSCALLFEQVIQHERTSA